MACVICGEKGFYRVCDREFCKNHKAEAAAITPYAWQRKPNHKYKMPINKGKSKRADIALRNLRNSGAVIGRGRKRWDSPSPSMEDAL